MPLHDGYALPDEVLVGTAQLHVLDISEEDFRHLLRALLPLLQQVLHTHQEHRCVEGLRDVGVGAGAIGRHTVVVIAFGCEHDDRATLVTLVFA